MEPGASQPWLPFGIFRSREGVDFCFPSRVQSLLSRIAQSPSLSHVSNGVQFGHMVLEVCKEFRISEANWQDLLDGISVFFDQMLVKNVSNIFFAETLPFLASLALRLPELLKQNTELVYKLKNSNDIHVAHFDSSILLPLQLLPPQQPGMILISQVNPVRLLNLHSLAHVPGFFNFTQFNALSIHAQELACAFLTGALFCSYKNSPNREKYDLPYVNFTGLFYGVKSRVKVQSEKLKCLIEYFNSVSRDRPKGNITFERKVLNHNDKEFFLSRNKTIPSEILSTESIWKTSTAPLCPFIVSHNGTIEDDGSEDLEVDFANKYLGGGTLNFGCVQEEIRFVISPELIVGMIFFPSMDHNETIQIIGSQRFSKYKGYANSFTFHCAHSDDTGVDSLQRRKTCVIAMDALCAPGNDQFQSKFALRELQKSLCGFLQHSIKNEVVREGKGKLKQRDIREYMDVKTGMNKSGDEYRMVPKLAFQKNENHCTFLGKPEHGNEASQSSSLTVNHFKDLEELKAYKKENCDDTFLGVSTGNWGCGAFGGDLQFKSILQWMAASQAQRSFICYFTFNDERAANMDKIVSIISSQNFTVKDLFDIIQKYAPFSGNEHRISFYDFILNSIGLS